MDRVGALCTFLRERFSEGDLRDLLREAHLGGLEPHIHWNQAMAAVSRDLVEAADNRGRIDATFFDAMGQVRPNHEHELEVLRRRWLTAPDAAGDEDLLPAAKLTFSPVVAIPPPPHSTASMLRFQLVNTGPGKAVLQLLELVVEEHRPSDTLRIIEVGAPIPEHRHHIELDPDIAVYDVRATELGPPPPLLGLAQDEIEAFLVEVTSTRSHWYAFHLRAHWYDTRSPADVHVSESERAELDFPPDPAELLGLDSG